MNNPKKFWKWRNQADGEPEARVLELYGTIASESWFDDDVTPQMFKDISRLEEHRTERI